MASAGAAPNCTVQASPVLPQAFLRMFFAGHQTFLDHSLPALEKSTTYRAHMKECRLELSSKGQPEELEYAISIANALKVWHFIEAVYLTEHTADDIHTSQFLTDWYIANCTSYADREETLLYPLGGEQPSDDDEEFWDHLLKLAIAGKFDVMLELLSTGKLEDEELKGEWYLDDKETVMQMTEAGKVDPAPMVTAVSRIMHAAKPNNISTRSDGSWEEWQNNCALWAESPDTDGHSGARRLLGLFSGDIEKITDACSSWEEMLVACALYGKFGYATGGNMRGGLALVSNACAFASAGFTAPDGVAGGSLLEAALGNVTDALVRMEASLPTSWFSAHLCDTLIKAGQMQNKEEVNPDPKKRPFRAREFYLTEFARGLERYRGCWRLAADYYLSCPSHGTSHLIDLLLRVPLEGSSDPTTEKVLLICKKCKLKRTAQHICEKLGADCLNQRNLGGAMSWFARASLLKRAGGVAELALVRAEREGSASQAARSLECVVTSMTNMGELKMRETLDYIRVYSEMQTALHMISSADDGNAFKSLQAHISDFVSLARRLVGGGGLPRKYWIVVVVEAAQVLEQYPEHQRLFSRTAINDLLGALQLASSPYRSQEMIAGLRGRLAHEATCSQTGSADVVELSTVEDAERVLLHCRSILVRSLASWITDK